MPHLRALADLWLEAKTIWMGAGPVPEILHRALIGFAWLVRIGLVRSLSPLAPLMHWATPTGCAGASIAVACSSRWREPAGPAKPSGARGTCWLKAMTGR
ncbi:hypothetical protein [Mesorhizobium sp. M0802]|uniref:hypothetical protein n=1 Tax=Mesorhizobium sp. M0802 TaxID=2957001 RepID=UPI0033365B75